MPAPSCWKRWTCRRPLHRQRTLNPLRVHRCPRWRTRARCRSSFWSIWTNWIWIRTSNHSSMPWTTSRYSLKFCKSCSSTTERVSSSCSRACWATRSSYILSHARWFRYCKSRGKRRSAVCWSAGKPILSRSWSRWRSCWTWSSIRQTPCKTIKLEMLYATSSSSSCSRMLLSRPITNI